jgi:hypothetical protein
LIAKSLDWICDWLTCEASLSGGSLSIWQISVSAHNS